MHVFSDWSMSAVCMHSVIVTKDISTVCIVTKDISTVCIVTKDIFSVQRN